mgnify:FL=1
MNCVSSLIISHSTYLVFIIMHFYIVPSIQSTSIQDSDPSRSQEQSIKSTHIFVILLHSLYHLHFIICIHIEFNYTVPSIHQFVITWFSQVRVILFRIISLSNNEHISIWIVLLIIVIFPSDSSSLTYSTVGKMKVKSASFWPFIFFT